MIQIKNITLGKDQPKIALPLMIKSINELEDQLAEFKRSEEYFEIIEWRVDFINNLTDYVTLIAIAARIQFTFPSKLLLFTCRTSDEGGFAKLDNDSYFELNKQMILSKKIDLVDIEFNRLDEKTDDFMSWIHSQNVHSILSIHNFQKMLSQDELCKLYEAMQQKDASIIKIAMMANNTQDLLTLLHSAHEINIDSNSKKLMAMIAMGQFGKLSRICGELFGSCLTFGTLKKASAAGQIEIHTLKKMLKILAIEAE